MKQIKNFLPLTPINFLQRSAEVFPKYTSIISEDKIFTWEKTFERCRLFSSALKKRGVKKGQVVSILCPNTKEMYESHFSIPMSGAILNTINTRYHYKEIEYILDNSKTKLLIIHSDYLNEIIKIKKIRQKKIPLIIIKDENIKKEINPNYENYETFLKKGSLKDEKFKITDEFSPISISYTSGTTGRPKAVITTHRAAYLNSLGNKFLWNIEKHTKFLWTLPMFHSNGWRFTWTIAALAGVNICLKKIDEKLIIKHIKKYNVTNMCCAPIVLKKILNTKFKLKKRVEVLMAGAAPSVKLIKEIEKRKFNITHMYGLAESSSSLVCEFQDKWKKDKLPLEVYKSHQGVRNLVLEKVKVVNKKTKKNVKKNGKETGEIYLKGNTVTSGYFHDKNKTKNSFENGWFMTGDLAVVHENGYIEIKDRIKDIIISGGENISSIEIETVLDSHPMIEKSAVVGEKDKTWGERPIAFVQLKTQSKLNEKKILSFCISKLAKYKVPNRIIFTKLDVTPTGKIKKYLLKKNI